MRYGMKKDGGGNWYCYQYEGRTPTAQEAADALADFTAQNQRKVALEALHAPFTYNGTDYGMTPDRQAVYDSLMGKHSRGGGTKTVVLALDGTPVKYGTRVDLKAFLDAVDAELETRLATLHDAV